MLLQLNKLGSTEKQTIQIMSLLGIILNGFSIYGNFIFIIRQFQIKKIYPVAPRDESGEKEEGKNGVNFSIFIL